MSHRGFTNTFFQSAYLSLHLFKRVVHKANDFNFLGDEIRSVAFDSLGDSLLDFRADVDSNSINWEGFDIDGKKYIIL